MIPIAGRFVFFLLMSLPGHAQTGEKAVEPVETIPRAPVMLDGESLFLVRGISALPADRRAAAIAGRVAGLARNPDYQSGSLTLVEDEGLTRIEWPGQLVVMTLTDADGATEGIGRSVLGKLIASRIEGAIKAYRQARTPDALMRGALTAIGVTAAFLVGLFVFLRVFRRAEGAAERFARPKVEQARIRTLPILETERLWGAVHNALYLLRAATIVFGALLYLNLVLALFPWTKGFAARVFDLLFQPLRSMGAGILNSLPDLAFLAVLFIVVRYVLKLTRLFFEAAGRRTIELPGFEPEWSEPTFRIARMLIIAFAAVVAYPYLPGSGSDAFKGVSLFIGVVFSLGSTGLISNILAGYSLTYRRAYRIGDRVRIGDVTGDVEAIRLQVTTLRSLKNEEIIIPNSVVLNSSVVNYSSLARKQGLILHTTVGIGYETPWRQVEAMLLMAAGRTPGLLREPPPFVVHSSLGDFCVTYEINAYCDQPQEQVRLYSDLHRNILDVFNEYDVQIMTPAYESDPDLPKVVPKSKWFEAPARSPSKSSE